MLRGAAVLALCSLGLLFFECTPVLLLAWGVAAVVFRKLEGAGREQPQERATSGNRVTQQGRKSQSSSDNVPDGPAHIEDTAVHKALEKVFACIYAQCIFVWIDAPEPAQEQPLYKALQKELLEVIEVIQLKTAHLKSTQVMVGLINTLTHHLQRSKNNAKSPRKMILETEAKKIAFFRRYAEELITYLLPSSLSQSQHTKCLLVEILALKVLKPTMQTLSDPDFLNQMLIMKMDPPAAPQCSSKNFPTEGDQEEPSQSTEDALTADPNNDDEEKATPKIKKKGVFHGLKKIKNKLKQSSHSKRPDADCLDGGFEVCYRSNWDDHAEEEGLGGLETDGGWSDSSDSEESSNMNNHMPGSHLWSTVTRMLCDEWKHGSWTATISNLQVLDDQRPMCSIHVEDGECPAEKHWDIERNIQTFLWIQNKLGEDFPGLNTFDIDSISNESLKMENIIVKETLNNFLQSLVSIVQIQNSDEALFFLLPVEVLAEEEFLGSASSEELVADGAAPSSFRAFSGKSKTKRRALSSGQDILPQNICKEIPALEDPCDGTLKTALSNLLSEVLGSSLSFLAKFTGIQNDLFDKVDEMISEGELISSIDRLRETLWPDGQPAPPIPTRSPEEKEDTRLKAEKQLLNLCTTRGIRDCWHRKAGTLFNIFQEQDQNEELICRWLLLLLDKVIPRQDRSWTIDDIVTDIQTVP
ncbi:uncharacterized protein LOC144829498 isoform X2 [Lissotriton helveticus]